VVDSVERKVVFVLTCLFNILTQDVKEFFGETAVNV
jgi:hypothetical protein